MNQVKTNLEDEGDNHDKIYELQNKLEKTQDRHRNSDTNLIQNHIDTQESISKEYMVQINELKASFDNHKVD